MDKRTRVKQHAEDIDLSPATLLADIEELTRARDAALVEKDEYLVALQRERAEFVNYRRRSAEERQAMIGLADEGLINKVLNLADDFDRAIEARPANIAEDPWVEGIAAIDRKLRLLLESEGVSPIDATPGLRFDPREHEAVANVPGSSLPDGAIVGELRRGYRLRDRVLRPALVAVAAGSDQGSAPGTNDTASTDNPIH
ncbi:MAG: nucleotide exchange factor GrpE [Chloroflexota bacterium]